MYCLVVTTALVFTHYTPVPLPRVSSKPATTQVKAGVYVVEFCTNKGDDARPFAKYIVELLPNGTYTARQVDYTDGRWRGSWYWCAASKRLIFNEEDNYADRCTLYYAAPKYIHKPPTE
jgi:hypothetical protein